MRKRAKPNGATAPELASGKKGSVLHSIGTLVRSGAETFARDAQEWGLTLRRALVIALAPLLAAIAFIATIPFPGLFRWVIDEDSFLENLQVLLILVAALLVARLSVGLIRAGQRGPAILYMLVTLGMFFILGEEISWGQRIFGLRTPEALEAINWQREISIHNITRFQGPFVYAALLAGMYGTLMPLVSLLFSAAGRSSTLRHLLIPPLCLVPAFFMPFGYRLYTLTFRPELDYPPRYRTFIITEFSEVTELCLYFGLLVFTWLNLRLLRREWPSARR